MKKPPLDKLVAVLVAGFMASGGSSAVSQEHPAACSVELAIEGEWVGAVRLRKEIVYLRLQFKAEQSATKVAVLSMVPGSPGQAADVDLKSSRVQFRLPRDSGELAFEGERRDDKLLGTVKSAQETGTFQFVRLAQVDSKLYDEYAGAYKLGPGKLVIIRRGDRLKSEAPFAVERSWLFFVDDSGRTRLLFPASNDRFFAGPGYLVPVPVEIEVAFIRNADGLVTGVNWQEPGHPRRFAPRSKRYTEESVRFQNGEVSLAARLLTPAGKGPHPAVVLIQGGPGPGNRNEQYLVVADIFAANGIAVLVYDKQGCGDSTGDWRAESYDDMANDALAAVQFLRTRKDINGRKVGLWGISEGGWIAPLAASRSKDIAFLILVSASGLSHAALDLALIEPSLREAEFAESEIQEAIVFENLSINFARRGTGWEELEPVLVKAKEKKWFPHTTIFTHTGGHPPTSRDHWFWRLYALSADHDPVTTLRKVASPVLAIWGERDKAMPPILNTRGVEQGLKEGGNLDHTLKVFPKGEHVLWLQDKAHWIQVQRYVPAYFDTMINWTKERVRRIE